MTDADSGTVDALATEVAVQIIKSFDGVHEVSDGELEALREEVGPAELLLAFSAIVYALVRLIDDHPAQFTIRDDAYTKVFTSPSLLQGAVAALRAQDVREADLPTMAGALAAASVGTPPSDWRRSLGQCPRRRAGGLGALGVVPRDVHRPQPAAARTRPRRDPRDRGHGCRTRRVGADRRLTLTSAY